MAKSELTHNKALCYNCLYKLNEFDTKKINVHSVE